MNTADVTDVMAPPATASKWQDLAVRALSAAVLIPLAALDIWAGGALFDIVLGGIAALLLWEWGGLTGGAASSRMRVLLAAGGLLAFALHFMAGFHTTVAVVALTALAAIVEGREGSVADRIMAAAGPFYIVAACLAMAAIRNAPANGLYLTVLLVCAVVATDIGAYISGRTIGGPKLAPVISPKKTWAGLAGAMICAGAAAFIVGLIHFGPDYRLLPVGAGIAVVAQMGDLLESWLKRRVGVKDSGKLIPGHGGVFDRLDGFLSSALVLWALTGVSGVLAAG